MWPGTRLLDLFGIEVPIVQAPTAAATDVEMAVAVAKAGGLGSLLAPVLAADKIYSGVTEIRSHIDRPINLNFFCHVAPQRRGAQADLAQSVMHLTTPSLAPRRRHSHSTQGLCPSERTFAASSIDLRSRAFKFGLPALDLLQHVKAAGCRVLNSATSVREARWLYENGADVVIAQGAEAGGHRGMFIEIDVDTQIETFALVPQIVDAVPVPVIAACGIAVRVGSPPRLPLARPACRSAPPTFVPRKLISPSCIARRSRSASPQPSSPTCSRDARRACSSTASSRSKVRSPRRHQPFPLPPIGRFFAVLVRRSPRARPRHECQGSDASDRRGKPQWSLGSADRADQATASVIAGFFAAAGSTAA